MLIALLIVEDVLREFAMLHPLVLLTVHHAQVRVVVMRAEQDTTSITVAALNVIADAVNAHGVQTVMLAMHHMSLNTVSAALLLAVPVMLTFVGDVKMVIYMKTVNVEHAQILARHAPKECVMVLRYVLKDALHV